ncbi:MAG: hypothetical protein V2B19_18625 [Pseudomonadota bacterium]
MKIPEEIADNLYRIKVPLTDFTEVSLPLTVLAALIVVFVFLDGGERRLAH